ncbi:asparagine synthetase B family protein [Thiohalobacter sp.]|uniref:asparagine synthetase B family protein n=1 Tax=Thiohalobacter sp. TaxID=2025948 RepID=UPI00260A2CB3|nr:asparagine synthase-related protein [Thiohalobacter sp.]
MRGLFGWISPQLGTPEPDAVARAMAGPFGNDASLKISGDTRGGLGVVGDETLLLEHGDLRFAIAGRARWQGEPLRPEHAETLAHAFRTQGPGLLDALHGSFALALIDLRSNDALLAVDRIGIEPLAVADLPGGLAFASRADSVAAHPATSSDLDPQSLYDYLYFHCVPSPRTIFQGQHKLLPAQYLAWHDGHARKDFYWAVEYRDEPARFAPLREAFLALQETVVREAVDAPETGAFLSGGTDSSTVTGFLARVLDGAPHTYSIGFEAEGYDEMEYARIAARHFGACPHEYYVSPADVVAAVPRIAAAYDEPFGNASAIPAFYCARMAAENGSRHMLAGDGGDEIFAGNARYVHQKLLELYRQVPDILRRGLVEPLAFADGLQGLPPVRKLRSYIEQTRTPLPDRMEAYNFLHRSPAATLFTPEFLASVEPDEPLAIIQDAYGRAHSGHYLNRMLHLELKMTLADNDLRKVSRTCELAGVRVRYPMLDQRLVEFAARVPPSLKLKGFRLRWFFKESLKDFLPREILRKPKQGFGLPFGVWLRDDPALQQLAGDSLASLRNRGWIKPAYIDELQRLHREEHAAYYGVMIWVLMMLEQWLQQAGR